MTPLCQPMDNITLPFGVTTSRLGFGCGGLMRLPRSTERKKILAAAFDNGIRYFDVAPMYGLGQAEKELGSFLQNIRDQVVIATKFGIMPTNKMRLLSNLQPIARAFFRHFPWLKQQAQKTLSTHTYTTSQFDMSNAKLSLANSFFALQTDHIDLLLLHEPTAETILSDDLHDWLQTLVTSQKIKAFGVAGYQNNILPVINRYPWLSKIIQMDNDPLHGQIQTLQSYQDASLISFAIFSKIFEKLKTFLTQSSSQQKIWSDLTGHDFTQAETLIHFLMAYALYSNPQGIVLFSTTMITHLQEIIKWIDEKRITKTALDAFINLIQLNRNAL